MTNKKRIYCLHDTREWSVGAEQIRSWHEECRLRRLRQRIEDSIAKAQ